MKIRSVETLFRAVLFSGCATSHSVALPAALEEANDRYTVAGRVTTFTHKVTFGPYAATDVRISTSGYDSGATVFNGQTAHSEVHHAGSYNLVTKSGSFSAKCKQDQVVATEHAKSVDYESRDGRGGLHVRDSARIAESTHTYQCSIEQPSGAAIELELDAANSGRAQLGDLELSIATIQSGQEPPQIAWGLKGGYLLLDGSTPIAFIDPYEASSTVTLSRELPQQRRDQAAAIAMVLLLKRDMR